MYTARFPTLSQSNNGCCNNDDARQEPKQGEINSFTQVSLGQVPGGKIG